LGEIKNKEFILNSRILGRIFRIVDFFVD